MTKFDAAVRPERPELLMASDEVITDAISHADPMALRGLLYMITGDPELEAMELKKVRFGRVESMAPASDDDIAMVRRKGVEYLKAYRDSGAGPVDYGTKENIEKSLVWIFHCWTGGCGMPMNIHCRTRQEAQVNRRLNERNC